MEKVNGLLNERFFDTGTLKLHVLEGPRNGPPLVLLHGATGSWTNWMPVIPALAERWSLVLLNARGHGGSEWPEGVEDYHIRYNVADLLAFLRDVAGRHPGERIVLVGHSYGAVTSMLAAKDAGDNLRAVVLVDPPLMLGRPAAGMDHFTEYFRNLYELRRKAKTFEAVRDALAARNPGMLEEDLLDYAQNTFWLDPNFPLALVYGDQRETMKGVDYREHYRAISCPALLMQAEPERGGALFDEDVELFMENAPKAKLVRFEDTGHGIFQEKPEAFLRVMEEFLEEVGS